MCKSKTMQRHKKKWFELGQRRCACGVQLVWNKGAPNEATAEHIIPSSQGGRNFQDNILLICRRCNEERGNTSWIDWILKNDFPKAEWLLTKYFVSVNKHLSEGHKLTIKARDVRVVAAWNEYTDKGWARIKQIKGSYKNA